MTALIVTASILGYLAGWMICVRLFVRWKPQQAPSDQFDQALTAFLWPLVGLTAGFYGLYRIATLPPKRERVRAKIDRLTEDISRLAEDQDR